MILRQVGKFWKVDNFVPGNLPEFGIKETDKVLDVGGGHCAFIRANVILDKFPETEYDDSQRAKGAMNIPDGARFIKGDAADMSCFKDKEFDFVVCAETINHCEDPIAVCKELIRVGKRGYVEMPGPLYEIFSSHQEHLWLSFWDGVTLKFLKNNYPKNCVMDISGIDRRVIEAAYHKMLACKDQEATFIDFIWEDSFQFEVINEK